jgi:hypothetical protein
MEQEKRTGEIENTRTISVGNTEWKRHFGRSRLRRNVKEIVMNCTKDYNSSCLPLSKIQILPFLYKVWLWIKKVTGD